MDSIIPLGQKNTLVEYMILSDADNRPSMLDKDLYDSWKSRMELYMQNRKHGRMILESVKNGPLIWPTLEENGDDPIVRLNKAMAFLTAVASSSLSDQGMQHDAVVPDSQVVQTIIPNNVAFQTEDVDTYDSDCDDISNVKAVLMANISNYGSDVISVVPHFKTYLNDIENQSVLAMQEFEQPPAVDFTDNEIHSDSDIILYS
nr:hypothetical protein [Tanacetum cinerariifolium]